jgi:UDP-2,3-diacylglucosamine hydrolase
MQFSHASAFLISDLHLTPSMPMTAQRFFDFCEKEAREVEAVFILGDLFEYWVGDDANAQSPFHGEVKNALAALSSRVKTYYMHGNRDFLVGSSFLKKTGMTLLPDPCTVQIAGDQYALSHGDGLCTADSGYQLYRSWTRKPSTQKWFLRLPLSWRHAIADRLRKNSKAQYRRDTRFSLDGVNPKGNVTLEACAALVRSQSSHKLIHGHTHLPARHHESLEGLEWQRWVLSDWDLDHPEAYLPKASALRIDQHGVRYLDLVKN